MAGGHRRSGLLTAWMTLIVVVGAVAIAPRAPAAERPGCGAGQLPYLSSPDACFEWQTGWRTTPVLVPSHTADTPAYDGVMFAPEQVGGPYPAVVVQHGYQGTWKATNWATRDLASQGYVVIAVTVPSSSNSGQSIAEFVTGVRSAIDFLSTDQNPFKAETDLERIGAAGHSEGSRAVSYAQSIDRRIDAIVAWDNLTSDLHGDAGTAIDCPTTGSGIPTRLEARTEKIVPRVPAMGQAQDLPCTKAPDQTDPEAKKSGYRAWRDARVPSVLVSFAGAEHLDWSQTLADTADNLVYSEQGVSERYRHFALLTHCWFDRWLRNDPAATAEIISAAKPLLSTRWTSAAYLDGIDCENLATCSISARS